MSERAVYDRELGQRLMTAEAVFELLSLVIQVQQETLRIVLGADPSDGPRSAAYNISRLIQQAEQLVSKPMAERRAHAVDEQIRAALGSVSVRGNFMPTGVSRASQSMKLIQDQLTAELRWRSDPEALSRAQKQASELGGQPSTAPSPQAHPATGDES